MQIPYILDEFSESLAGHKDVNVLISCGVAQHVRDKSARDCDAGATTFCIL